jgi:YHS domain-containing protein
MTKTRNTHPTKSALSGLTAMIALALGAGSVGALAQDDPKGQDPAKTGQPGHDERPGAQANEAGADGRIGDPYPFDTCPITGKKLGSMGDSVTKLYDGREVRFCCTGCPGKFEKDRAAGLAGLDEKIVKDQSALYPLKTSVVTGKELPVPASGASPAKPFEFVYGNRLVRLGAEVEKAEFLKDPKRYLGELDTAVIGAQLKDYPLKTCPVSNEELGGEMGEARNKVIAGRLIRLCCNDCKKDVERDPAKYIAMVDGARKSEKDKPAAGHPPEKGHGDKKPDDHK